MRTNVFLNVPFDSKYEPLFIALIASVVASGGSPKSVLEIPDQGQGRLSRLVLQLRQCPASIHDLSRVGRPVRFNMPFELGLAVALSRSPVRHRFTILEKERYRLQKTLSDLNGIDPCIHNRSVRGIISCVLSQMRRHGRNPTPGEVLSIYRVLRRVAAELKKQHMRSTVFSRAIFEEIVEAAGQLAKANGLLR